jgi:putative PEP-CTERM system TPR-repeat lipoprotein
MKRAIPIILLTLTATLAACKPADDPAALVSSAKDYVTKRDFSAAIIQLKNALEKDPSNAEARYLLGVASLENGDPISAEAELTKAIGLGMQSDELEVAFARALLAKGEAARLVAEFGSRSLAAPQAQAELRALVGMAELQRGERGRAEVAFGQALSLDAANVTANLGAARLAAGRTEFRAAMSRVEAALASSPFSAEAHALKADLLAFQGERQPAEQAYREAIKLAPRQVGPRMSLISHLLRHRALEQAAAEAAELAKVAPRSPHSSFAQALVLVEQRQFAAARNAILPVLEVAPDHVPSLTLAGLAALETGAFAEAESHLRKAVFKAPQSLVAKRLLATTHLRMGQSEVALSEAKELVARAGAEPRILALAGEAYLANGDAASAAHYYEKANALAPEDPKLRTRLAQMHFAAGDAERGIKELESASASDPNSFQADLGLVATYLRQRQADKALGAVETLEKKQPDNPLTHNLRGLALLLKRDAAGARASFERAVELQPAYMPAVRNLARLDLRDKNPEAAKRRYQAVLSKQPNNEQALLGLAVLLRVTGADPKEIEPLLKQSVAANPASANARAALVNFHLRARDVKSALAAAQEAQAAMPKDTTVAQVLGATQLVAGENVQALATFKRLAELSPKAAEAQVMLARAHMANKQPDEAINALRAALALRPDLPNVQRDIAAIYIATGRHEEALREAKAAQAQLPKQPLGYVLEAEIYVVQKQLDLAERKYRETLQRFDLPLLAMRTHAVMDAAGKRSEADALAEEWIKKHPGDATLLGYLGGRDIAAKRYGAAAKRYRSALERQPDNAEFLNNLAWVAHRLNDGKALQYAERAHELAPSNAAVMDTLGWILVESGDMERGVELLGRAAELAPEAPEIRLNFAKALIKADRKSAARKELEALAKLDGRIPAQQEAAKLLSGL